MESPRPYQYAAFISRHHKRRERSDNYPFLHGMLMTAVRVEKRISLYIPASVRCAASSACFFAEEMIPQERRMRRTNRSRIRHCRTDHPLLTLPRYWYQMRSATIRWLIVCAHLSVAIHNIAGCGDAATKEYRQYGRRRLHHCGREIKGKVPWETTGI